MKRAAAMLAAMLLGLAGCDRFAHHDRLTLSGTLEMTEHSVGARVPGRLDTLSVDDGADVTKGQVLATLDRFAQTKKDYDRMRTLFEQGGAMQQAVEQAQLAVDDQQVVSPVDGVVLLKVHEPGEVVAAGSLRGHRVQSVDLTTRTPALLSVDWPHANAFTRVAFAIEEKSGDRCALHFVHEGFPEEEEPPIVPLRCRWSDRLVGLKNVVETGASGFTERYDSQVSER